ncbi:Acyl-CoA N-acyltransferases (NAT) superfamily protein [Abeliophyllum distichum]|uniref:N-alpha-acetyltransferase 60 n=1 Tax=Abeliophyllum distichum TaxID=126358 RepID=A0ABD1VUH2_9LAMI
MVNFNAPRRPIISYRPIRPSDLEVLEKIHRDLFPIRYESEFFRNAVNGRDIVCWGAVDRSRPNAQSNELIGFVTAKIVSAKESEVEDFISYDLTKPDQTLIYILTLGVVESHRNLGIASSLIHKHYDSYLFIYYVNGGRSPCSPLELVTLLVTYVKSGYYLMVAKLWKNEDKKISKWPMSKESGYLLPVVQNKRILTAEGTRCQYL